MMRLKLKNNLIATTLILIIILVASCSKAVKPSEDIVRIKAVLSAVTKLQDKYKGKDFGDFMAIVSPKYNASFKNAVEKSMTEFDEIDLAIYVDRIDMDKESARVNLHWEGTWKKGGKSINNNGNSVFTLTNEAGPKLSGIAGSNPFELYSISSTPSER